MKFLVIITIILLQFHFVSSEEGQINIVLKHSTCAANKKYITKMTSIRRPLNRTTSLTSMDIYFLPNVTIEEPIYAHVIANKKFTTQYRPFMIDIKSELCEILLLKNHPILKFGLVHTDNTESNILDPCPLKGHRYVKPYHTSYTALPPLVPIGMWRIDYIFTKKFDDKEEEIFRNQDYYEITPKGAIEF